MTVRPLVAVRLAPGPAWIAAVERVWAGGGAVLPLPWHATVNEVSDAVDRFCASHLIDGGGEVPLDCGAPVLEGTAVVLSTSGSTGAPKGVELSHAALECSARASLERLGVTDGDRWLCCLPLHHVAGLQVLTRSRLMGVDAEILNRFDVAAVASHRDVTHIALVPTMLRRLLDAGVDLSHLRCILLGGAPPGPGLLEAARLRGLRVVTTYGMTETSGGCVYDGVPLDGVEVALDDDGRIRLRGPTLFSGYRRSRALTEALLHDGWLLTEDVGRWTADGRLEVVGRADDMIITGGENVPAGWVATVLEEHPDVVEASIVGAPDREWGQRVVAVVVTGDRAPALEELRDFVGARASRIAAPRELLVVPALPHLDNGKVDRVAVARLVADAATDAA